MRYLIPFSAVAGIFYDGKVFFGDNLSRFTTDCYWLASRDDLGILCHQRLSCGSARGQNPTSLSGSTITRPDHVIEKESPNFFNELEHVLIEKAKQLLGEML
jgi:hypothetical protein